MINRKVKRVAVYCASKNGLDPAFGKAAEESADHESGAVGKAAAEPVADAAGGSGTAEFAHRLDQQGFRA